MKNNLIKGMMVAMAAMTLFSGSAVYATEDTETVTETEVSNVDAKQYILLLPVRDGVTYGLDSSHVSEQYSSENYTVLLYKEGEQVDITVSGATEFYVADALDTDGENIADGADGKISFTMPAQDLSLTVPSWAVESTDSTTVAAADGTADIRVSTTRLNVRDGASTDSTVISLLTPGDLVRVTGTEGDWLAVRFIKDGAVADGYVSAQYVTGTSSLYSAVSAADVWSSNSETSTNLGQLAAGEEVAVQEVGTDGWSKISYVSGGKVTDAYVKSELLSAVTDPSVNAILS